MRCQHCLAICPKGAVTFNGKRPEDSLPVEGLAVPSIVQMENYMRVRRSVRRYRDCDVERQVLERIFKALGNSPTGCNARNLKFTCFATRKAMDEFREKFIRAIEEHRDGETDLSQGQFPYRDRDRQDCQEGGRTHLRRKREIYLYSDF